MPEWWPAVVFGWPAVVVSLVLAAAGIVFRIPVLLLVSGVLAAPFSYYLSSLEGRVHRRERTTFLAAAPLLVPLLREFQPTPEYGSAPKEPSGCRRTCPQGRRLDYRCPAV